jgi:hypothetical protein
MMEVGDKVVYTERNTNDLIRGNIYIIEKIDPKFGEGNYESAILHLQGVKTGYFDWRFRSLEQMQNENFISIAKAGIE